MHNYSEVHILHGLVNALKPLDPEEIEHSIVEYSPLAQEDFLREIRHQVEQEPTVDVVHEDVLALASQHVLLVSVSKVHGDQHV